jgi:hypothetical protein
MTLAHAITLERWSWGLLVMLEKILWNTLVTKLRAILFMRRISMPPTKYSMVIRCYIMHKTTTILIRRITWPMMELCAKPCSMDTTWNARVSAAIASVDALNCCDRIVHAMASVVFQTFGVPTSAVDSMLKTIKNMIIPLDMIW